jgi:hypothetical protein
VLQDGVDTQRWKQCCGLENDWANEVAFEKKSVALSIVKENCSVTNFDFFFVSKMQIYYRVK